MRRTLATVPVLVVISILVAVQVRPATTLHAAPTVQAPFNASYTFFSVGSVPGLPTPYGGLTILPSNPNKLLIGGAANSSSGRLYTI